MNNIQINSNHVLPFVSRSEIEVHQCAIDQHFNALKNKTGKGNDFLGWVNLPSEINNSLIQDINDCAKTIAGTSDIFVVIGIGGSYLGARAVIESLKHHFDMFQSGSVRKHPVIVYAGHQISEDYMADLMDILNERDYSVAVISKSGTTTEPALAFRLLKGHLENKYGKAGAVNRIIAITDKERGALKKLAIAEGYKTYDIPDDVGGRYSVLTPVGLLPIAVAGFDIGQLVDGARQFQEFCFSNSEIKVNPVSHYAAVRNALYRKGKTIEILVNYQPNLMFFTEWWKQLYGESEGKENKGIFPAGVNFTSDLHSMGQYIQEGIRNIFETVISVETQKRSVVIPVDPENLDQMNFLSGKNLHFVNQMAEMGTTLAHVDGGVPNIRIQIPKIDEFNIGQLIYFFELACAVSGYILDVNPFDQPGVEAYKKNMFALLGKPGFEEAGEVLKRRIQF